MPTPPFNSLYTLYSKPNCGFREVTGSSLIATSSPIQSFPTYFINTSLIVCSNVNVTKCTTSNLPSKSIIVTDSQIHSLTQVFHTCPILHTIIISVSLHTIWEIDSQELLFIDLTSFVCTVILWFIIITMRIFFPSFLINSKLNLFPYISNRF